MTIIHPSLTLVLDIDEQLFSQQLKLEIMRCYSHIGTPVIRTHARGFEDASNPEGAPDNRARFIVSMGTKRYLHSSDEGADELWETSVEPWIASMLYKVTNNMAAFNRRMRKIGLPELVFSRIDLELEGGAFTVGLAPDPEGIIGRPIAMQAGLARTLLNSGILEGARRVDAPSATSLAAQAADAQAAWDAAHAMHAGEDEGGEGTADDDGCAEDGTPIAGPLKHYVGPMPDPKLEPEAFAAWKDADAAAKSYERTAVAPTESNELPPIGNPVEAPEPERFTFPVDYSLWDVTFADGTVRAFDSRSESFL